LRDPPVKGARPCRQRKESPTLLEHARVISTNEKIDRDFPSLEKVELFIIHDIAMKKDGK
jgi:hypothetical protein